MKLSEFILLSEGEKAKATISEGVLVAKRKTDPLFYFLFQLPHYYVEMCCNRTDKSIVEFRTYTGTVFLQPYLEEISLKDVI